MSILIKGMEMPEAGEYRCVIRQWKRGEPLTIDLYGEEELCGTISHVPEPHGRLIDADVLLSKDRQIYRSDGAAIGARKHIEFSEIKDAPTIIPAEEGET